MILDIVPLQPLEAGQGGVMRIYALAPAAVLLAAALAAEAFAPEYVPFRGFAAGAALLLALWWVLVVPARRWKHWGYAFTGSELHVAQGRWVESHTIVPVSRVQHIDVSQGPVERAFGVTTLAVHTAGTMHSIVVLPGITRETAESIRDAIRARIGSATA